MYKQLADYHIHTSFCNHANGTMKAYVKQAILMGLGEMGFADHNPLPSGFNNYYRMQHEDLAIYSTIIEDLKAQFPQIQIRFGIELDYITNAIDYLKNLVEENNFDYIIGSVHYLNADSSHQTVYLNDWHGNKKTERFQIYFEAIEEAIGTGLFDIIGHFDLPRRFWGDLDNSSMVYAISALELIKKQDVCLEVNTSGFRTKNVEEPFPGCNILHYAKEMEIPITLGSDSHSPYNVGSCFNEALILLQKIGFKDINLFAQRKRIPVQI